MGVLITGRNMDTTTRNNPVACNPDKGGIIRDPLCLLPPTQPKNGYGLFTRTAHFLFSSNELNGCDFSKAIIILVSNCPDLFSITVRMETRKNENGFLAMPMVLFCRTSFTGTEFIQRQASEKHSNMTQGYDFYAAQTFPEGKSFQ